ncbi:MAG: cupin domain-containing protein [Methanocorpusculum sp.]|nr:cupin domain-containing protein [Methanocorpusculum sp.]
MIINFDKIDETVTPNFKGGEKEAATRVFDNGKIRVLTLKLVPGASIGMHTHETNSETMYVIEGKGKVVYDGKIWELAKGNCHYCGLGHSHSIINDGDSDLILFAQIIS